MLHPDFEELLKLGNHKLAFSKSAKRPVNGQALGHYRSPFRGQGLEFEEVRAYQVGDDIRNIDWRVTARTGKPHLKLFSEDRERTVLLCIDVNESMQFGTRGTFKSVQAARLASIIGGEVCRDKNRLGACIYGAVDNRIQCFTPSRSRKAYWRLLKTLSQSNAINKTQPVDLLDALVYLNKAAPTGALIYIISDFAEVNDAWQKPLKMLKGRCDVVAVSINDPSDKDFPHMGLLELSSGHGESYLIDTDNEQARLSYQQCWLDNRAQFEQMMKLAQIHTIQCFTHRNIQEDFYWGIQKINTRSGRV